MKANIWDGLVKLIPLVFILVILSVMVRACSFTLPDYEAKLYFDKENCQIKLIGKVYRYIYGDKFLKMQVRLVDAKLESLKERYQNYGAELLQSMQQVDGLRVNVERQNPPNSRSQALKRRGDEFYRAANYDETLEFIAKHKSVINQEILRLESCREFIYQQ